MKLAMHMGTANNNLAQCQINLWASARNLAEYVVPPLLAGLAVWEEPLLTRLSRTHEALLPLAVMLLLAMLLHPRLRKYLVVTLCYGVTCLALRDAQRVVSFPLPPALQYDWVYTLQPIALWLVAALAAVSGIAETAKPGTVWARRCYFGAAALYFTGLGVMYYATKQSWQSVLLCITGLTAVVGCVMAHRIVAAEAAAGEDQPNDEILQEARDAAHRTALQTKEWRDNLKSMIEEHDNSSANPSIDVSGSI